MLCSLHPLKTEMREQTRRMFRTAGWCAGEQEHEQETQEQQRNNREYTRSWSCCFISGKPKQEEETEPVSSGEMKERDKLEYRVGVLYRFNDENLELDEWGWCFNPTLGPQATYLEHEDRSGYLMDEVIRRWRFNIRNSVFQFDASFFFIWGWKYFWA